MPKCNICKKELNDDSFDMRKDGKALLKTCHTCNAKRYCIHNKLKSRCIDCGGGSICEHNRERHMCKICGGGSFCEHKKRRSRCIDCGGGSICSHNKIRSLCIDCGGGSICEHNKIRSRCQICDLGGYLKSIVSNRIRDAIKADKEFKLVAQSPLGERAMATPAFSEKKIYIRGEDHLYCIAELI